MTLSELQYITQDNIDQAYINVTSAEMYAEVHDYNTHAYDMHRRRRLFLTEFWSMMLVDLILIPAVTVIGGKYTNLMAVTGYGTLSWLSIGLLGLFMFFYCFFVLYKKNYSWKLCLAYSLLILPLRLNKWWYLYSALFAALNCWLISSYKKIDDMLKGEAGYPHFVQLTASYIRDEENAEEGSMEGHEDADSSDDLTHKEEAPEANPFDKYRIKPEDDQGLLRDTDIEDKRKSS